MGKSYLEQLGDWVEQRESKPRDKSLVAFLAVRDDVKTAMEAGYSAKTVWGNMRESRRIAFGYDTFLKYVYRFLSQQQASPATKLAEPESLAAAPDGARRKSRARGKTPSTTTRKPATPAGFTFNPVPKKEELL